MMNKKGVIHWLLLFVVVAGIFAVIYFVRGGPGDSMSFVGGDTYVSVADQDSNSDVDDSDQGSIDPVVDVDRVPLDTYFEHNFPVYIDSRRSNCLLAGGTWVSSDDSVGCYDVLGWDSSLCGSAELWTLKSVCVNLGALFSCDVNEVSCEYA